MNKQAVIECLEGLIGILLWALYVGFFPAIQEGWVYLPIFLGGIIAFVMIFRKKDYTVPDGFAPYYRKANLGTTILTLCVCVIAFLSQNSHSNEVLNWGLWLVFVIYFFLFCHGVALGFYYNQKYKKK